MSNSSQLYTLYPISAIDTWSVILSISKEGDKCRCGRLPDYTNLSLVHWQTRKIRVPSFYLSCFLSWMVSQTQYNTLKNASDCYLSQEFRMSKTLWVKSLAPTRSVQEMNSEASVMDTLLEWFECVWRAFAGHAQRRDVPMVCTEFSSTWSLSARPTKHWLDAQSRRVNRKRVQISTNSVPIWAGRWRNYGHWHQASSNPRAPSEVISTQLLSDVADREAERERRRKNGIVPPRQLEG